MSKNCEIFNNIEPKLDGFGVEMVLLSSVRFYHRGGYECLMLFRQEFFPYMKITLVCSACYECLQLYNQPSNLQGVGVGIAIDVGKSVPEGCTKKGFLILLYKGPSVFAVSSL